MENGEAFIFARSDWQYVLNTFCFGYNVGYKFIGSRRRRRATATSSASGPTIAARPWWSTTVPRSDC